MWEKKQKENLEELLIIAHSHLLRHKKKQKTISVQQSKQTNKQID